MTLIIMFKRAYGDTVNSKLQFPCLILYSGPVCDLYYIKSNLSSFLVVEIAGDPFELLCSSVFSDIRIGMGRLQLRL